jgi:hypothetical protein
MYFIYILYSTYIYKGLSVVSKICTCMKKSHLLFLSSIADKWTMYINYAVVISHSSLFIPSSSYLCYTLLYSFDIIQYHLSNQRQRLLATSWRNGIAVRLCKMLQTPSWKVARRWPIFFCHWPKGNILYKLTNCLLSSWVAIGLRLLYCTNLHSVYFPVDPEDSTYTVQAYILNIFLVGCHWPEGTILYIRLLSTWVASQACKLSAKQAS